MDYRIRVYDADSESTLQVRRSIQNALQQISIPTEEIERILAFYANDIQAIAVPPPPLPPREPEDTWTYSTEPASASKALNGPLDQRSCSSSYKSRAHKINEPPARTPRKPHSDDGDRQKHTSDTGRWTASNEITPISTRRSARRPRGHGDL